MKYWQTQDRHSQLTPKQLIILKTMKQIDYLRHIALSFPNTTELPHFEKTSFRVKNKIFVIYDEKNNRACVKLSETK